MQTMGLRAVLANVEWFFNVKPAVDYLRLRMSITLNLERRQNIVSGKKCVCSIRKSDWKISDYLAPKKFLTSAVNLILKYFSTINIFPSKQ